MADTQRHLRRALAQEYTSIMRVNHTDMLVRWYGRTRIAAITAADTTSTVSTALLRAAQPLVDVIRLPMLLLLCASDCG